MSSTFEKWRLGSSQLTPQQIKSVKVSVKKGDILDTNCEVIINTTGHDFVLAGLSKCVA